MSVAFNIISSGHVEVREILESGVVHRYVLAPGDDLTGQPADVATAAAAAWTLEILAAWQAHLDADAAIQAVAAAKRVAANNYAGMIRRRAAALVDAGDQIGALILLHTIGE